MSGLVPGPKPDVPPREPLPVLEGEGERLFVSEDHFLEVSDRHRVALVYEAPYGNSDRLFASDATRRGWDWYGGDDAGVWVKESTRSTTPSSPTRAPTGQRSFLSQSGE